MKTILTLTGALAACAMAAEPVILRTTAADLAKLQQTSPTTSLESPAEGKAQVTKPAEQSIIRQSMVLNDGRNWTLVPKGAVVFLPEALKSRAEGKPVGTLLPFTDFMSRNLSWITTNEVSFNQAAGSESIPAERAEFWTKQDKMVIAVHQGGPISVRMSAPTQAITQR